MSGPLPFSSRVEAFCTRLTDRRIDGSLAAAKGTAELLRQLVTSSKLNTPELMLAEVKKVGLRIQAAKPIGAGACMVQPRPAAALLAALALLPHRSAASPAPLWHPARPVATGALSSAAAAPLQSW